MRFFHFSPCRNFFSIKSRGLRVNTGKTGFCVTRKCIARYRVQFGMQPIFLTSSPLSIVRTQLGDTWKKYDLYRVDIAPSLLERNRWCSPEFEYICREDIPPEALSLVLPARVLFR
jgi:hypothetical protein